MRHRSAGRKLGRTTAHRIALLRNLATALLREERIETTLPKAKELRPFAEKIITLAKREGTAAERVHARRLAARDIHDPDRGEEAVRRDRVKVPDPERRLHPHRQARSSSGRQRGHRPHRTGRATSTRPRKRPPRARRPPRPPHRRK